MSSDARTPSVAAVIPLYNGEKTIEIAVRSVLEQTVPVNEIVVVDDGSTDDGPSVVEKLRATEPTIHLVRKENGGQGSARNAGVRHSRSELIAFLDQDDLWYPRHIEVLSAPFATVGNRALGWVYSNLDEVDAAGLMVTHNLLTQLPAAHPKSTLVECLHNDMFVLPSAAVVARQALEQAGGFDEQLRGYEDDDLFLRIYRLGYDNVFIDDALSQWRIHAGSSSYTPWMSISRMKYFRTLCSEFPDEPARGRYFTRDHIAPRFFNAAYADFAAASKVPDREAMHRLQADLDAIARVGGARERALATLTRSMNSSTTITRFAQTWRSIGVPQRLARVLMRRAG